MIKPKNLIHHLLYLFLKSYHKDLAIDLALSRQNKLACFVLLKRANLKYNSSLAKLVKHLVHNIKRGADSISKHEEVTDELIELLDKSSDCSLGGDILHRVSQLVGSLGFLRLSYVLRERAIDAILYFNEANPEDATKQLALALERSEKDLASKIISRSARSYNNGSDLNFLRHYGSLIFSGSIEVDEQVKSVYSDPYFIRRQVTILGPSARCVESNNVVAQSEILAALNYLGPESLPDGIRRNIDVSYYVNRKINILLDKDDASILSNLHRIVLKSFPGGREQLERNFARLSQAGLSHKSFSTPDVFSLFALGLPNLGPIGIYDSIVRGAAQVHICNMDLYANSFVPSGYQHKINSGDAESRTQLHKPALCRSFSYIHPPAAQHRFLMNLRRAHLITTDSSLGKILDMSTEGFVRELDALYGLPNWNN